ncbi:MAG TPA: RloB family protein, partial [Methanocorpusculum sp.]|nr:RloB family protein [Methanocorpusculum sp.]
SRQYIIYSGVGRAATGTMTVGSVADHFIEWLCKNHYLCGGKKSVAIQKEQKREVLGILKGEGYDPSDEITDFSRITAILDKNLHRLCSSGTLGSHIHEFIDILQKQKAKYDKKYDSACFFMDRDELNVTPSDFEEARRLCEQNHISLYVSNPRFEFWLLLHFLSREMMDMKEIQDPHSKYLESCLGEILKTRKQRNGYSKTSYKAEAFVNRKEITDAITNESAFCESCNGLCNTVGCNIGLLMDTLLNKEE